VLLAAASFVALIDTGSTHSFIGEAAARRTGLPIEPRPRLTATVANGERVSCPGVIRQAPILIDGMEFRVDLFVMPLAGYDVVLGTH
jgi:predicted aspartyl protease